MNKHELKGVAQMQAAIRKLAMQVPDAAGKALYLEAEMVMTKSKRDFVPVDLGNLRASGIVLPPERRGDEVSVTLAYGGPSAPYALAIHEHPSASSPPSWRGKPITFHPSGRGPKYLERPLRDAIAGMPERLRARLFGGGKG